MTIRQASVIIGVIVLVLAAGASWLMLQPAPTNDQAAPINVTPEQNEQPTEQAPPEKDPLRFSVATMWSIESTFFMYRELVERVARDVDRPGSFVLRSSYAELDRAVRAGNIDVAFVCTGPYVDLLQSKGAEILVSPQFEEGITYRSLLLVPSSSDASGFTDLAGQTIAFADPVSFTGCLVPCVEMARKGIFPPEFFKQVLFAGNHERAIRAVDRGLADAAAVHSIVWESARREDTELESRLKVIWSSPAYGVPPVVVPSNLEPQLKEQLQAAFLRLHEDPAGRKILAELNITRFRLPEPGAYKTAIELYEELSSYQRALSWLSKDGL